MSTKCNTPTARNYTSRSRTPTLQQSFQNAFVQFNGLPQRFDGTDRKDVYLMASMTWRCGCDPTDYSWMSWKIEELYCSLVRHQRQIPIAPITVGSTTVTPVRAVLDFGIYIDCGLTMQAHVAKTVSSCFGFFDAAFASRWPNQFSRRSSFSWYRFVWISQARLLPVCPTCCSIDFSPYYTLPRDWSTRLTSTIA